MLNEKKLVLLRYFISHTVNPFKVYDSIEFNIFRSSTAISMVSFRVVLSAQRETQCPLLEDFQFFHSAVCLGFALCLPLSLVCTCFINGHCEIFVAGFSYLNFFF